MFSLLDSVPLHIASPFQGVTLDDSFSRVNRVYLFAVCLISGTVVTLNDFAGQKISCHGYTMFEGVFAEQYCWVQGLYTVLEGYDLPTQHIPYPGILPGNIPCYDFTYPNGTEYQCPPSTVYLPLTKVYHLWYQWISFYFWACAVVFSLPYVILKNSDLGSVEPAILMLKDTIDTPGEERLRLDKCSYWFSSKLSGFLNAKGLFQFFLVKHKYCFILMFNKVLNVVVVALVIILTNQIFKVRSFITYGYDWVRYLTQEQTGDLNNPVVQLFPRMIACEIKKWGTTGIQDENGMCVLAPNVINSYFFLIFWFILLIALLSNTLALLIALFKYFFIAASWRALISSTFTSSTAKGKWLFYNSGGSGRILLEILAKNVTSQTFEKVFREVCVQVVTEERNSVVVNTTAK